MYVVYSMYNSIYIYNTMRNVFNTQYTLYYIIQSTTTENKRPNENFHKPRVCKARRIIHTIGAQLCQAVTVEGGSILQRETITNRITNALGSLKQTSNTIHCAINMSFYKDYIAMRIYYTYACLNFAIFVFCRKRHQNVMVLSK